MFERLDDVGVGDELGDRRQVVERVEPELLEELRRRAEQDRLAWPVSRPTSSM